MRRYGHSFVLLLLGAHTASVRAEAPTLHERVPDVRSSEVLDALRRAEQAQRVPTLRYQGELLPAADPAQVASHATPMQAAGAPSAGRQPAGKRARRFHPDRQTQLEGRLTYDAGFTPTVAPFKRVSALDQVVWDADTGTPVLTVAQPTREDLPVADGTEAERAGSPRGDAGDAQTTGLNGQVRRDRFWGEALLDFSVEPVVPLPSVAAGARILSYATAPSVALRFARDGADNHYAELDTAAGDPAAVPAQVRVRFLTDAPRSYFGAPLPDVAVDVLAHEVPPMPALVRVQALALADELGLGAEDGLAEVLSVLTAHFRSFEEAAAPPEDTGDILRDLVRGGKGVCRHRAYGFTILAQALGVPTRYVQNEAHAWVEVKLPESGWMRIDLGGAAEGLEARGAGDRPLYQPAYEDDLPRPPAYQESYSQLQGDVQGLRSHEVQRITGRWIERDARGPMGAESDDPSGAAASHPVLGLPTRAEAKPGSDTEGWEPLQVAVDQRRMRIVRGERLQVSGRVRDGEGRGLKGQRVELSLAEDEDTRTLLLGVTVTDAQGRFATRVGIPPDLEVGDYRLVVIAPGDGRYAPGMAE